MFLFFLFCLTRTSLAVCLHSWISWISTRLAWVERIENSGSPDDREKRKTSGERGPSFFFIPDSVFSWLAHRCVINKYGCQFYWQTGLHYLFVDIAGSIPLSAVVVCRVEYTAVTQVEFQWDDIHTTTTTTTTQIVLLIRSIEIPRRPFRRLLSPRKEKWLRPAEKLLYFGRVDLGLPVGKCGQMWLRDSISTKPFPADIFKFSFHLIFVEWFSIRYEFGITAQQFLCDVAPTARNGGRSGRWLLFFRLVGFIGRHVGQSGCQQQQQSAQLQGAGRNPSSDNAGE